MKQNEQKTSSGLKWAIVLLAVLLVLSCAALVGRYVYHTYLAAPAVATVPDNLIEEEPASEPEPESEVSSADENPEEDAAADTENAGKAAEQSLTEGSQQSSAGDTAPVGTTPAQSTVQGQTSDGSSNTGADGGTQATVIELYKGRPDANQKFEVNNMFPGDRVTQYFCVRVYHDQPIQVFFRPEITYQTQSLGDALTITATRLGMGGMLCDDAFSRVSGHSYGETFQPNADGVTVLYYRVEVYADTSMGNEYQQAALKADF